MAMSALQKRIMERFRHERAISGATIRDEFGPGALDTADRLVARHWLTFTPNGRSRVDGTYAVHPSVFYPH